MREKKKLIFAVVIVVVIVLGLSFYIYHHNAKKVTTQETSTPNSSLTTTDTKICSDNNIPTDLCSKAIKLGYYCPSWNAKPGQVEPDFCMKLNQKL